MESISGFIEKRVARQLWFPFAEHGEIPRQKEDAVILFHLPGMTKQNLADQARLEGLSVTGLLNTLISGYISGKLEALKSALKPKAKTGRGNINLGELRLAKEFLRKKHPAPVRIVDIANYCKVTQARAARLVDLLSGGENKGGSASGEINDSFLLWQEGGEVGIFKDVELGVMPWGDK